MNHHRRITMARKQFEICPNCGEKKVVAVTDIKVMLALHDLHIIHAPYEDHRVWACHSCGWVAAVRWHAVNHSPQVYFVVREALVEPEPEPEPKFETFTPEVNYDDEVE